MSDKNPPEMSRSRQTPPAINLPRVVWVLIMVLVGIQFVLEWGGEHWQAFAVYTFAFIPARLGSVHFPQPPGAAIWSFLTYGFLHANWSHVLGNSLWLAVFSKPVQARLGTLRYLILLALSIIAGAAATLVLHGGEPLQLTPKSLNSSMVLCNPRRMSLGYTLSHFPKCALMLTTPSGPGSK